MIDITEKYNQEKESTIQYDVSKLLQTDLSDYLKGRLMNLGNPEVDKFVTLFPIQGTVRISVIRDSLNGIKEILMWNWFSVTLVAENQLNNKITVQLSVKGKRV